jgi:hypothetical protein
MRIPAKHAAVALLVLAATGGVTVGVASSGACQGGDAALAGRYRMSNVLGVGSDIRLKSDGSFLYNLTYGALRQKGAGCWVQNGRTVALLPEGQKEIANVQTLSNIDFRGLELQERGDGALVWDIANTGRKAVYVRR